MNKQVESCYIKMGGDYSDAVHRFETDLRIIKYLKMMRADTNFASLCHALEEKKYDSAFRAAHTLKGVALNLSLTRLADAASQLTDALRNGPGAEDYSPLLEEMEAAYRQMCIEIDQLLEEIGGEGDTNENAR